VRLIIGSDLPPRPVRTVESGEPIVVFDGVCAGVVGPLSFNVHSGEVLGITGLSGAGHAAVPQVLFGGEPIRRGSVHIDGVAFTPRSPADAVGRGLALVPADRNGEGAVPSMDLRENLFMNPRSSWRSLIRRSAESSLAAGMLRAFDVRPPAPLAEFSTLSGGNAQKVVLARALSSSPRVLVLEEPTAAVDIGARNEIHHRIREIARSGPAVILVSSDLEEIEQVCDRAIVMERGRIRGVLEGQSVTAATLLEAAYGVHSHG
jgi:ribose transport system ATP-binding protein